MSRTIGPSISCVIVRSIGKWHTLTWKQWLITLQAVNRESDRCDPLERFAAPVPHIICYPPCAVSYKFQDNPAGSKGLEVSYDTKDEKRLRFENLLTT